MKTEYEIWHLGEWVGVTENQYIQATNNNHYGRINGVNQHGGPLKAERKDIGVTQSEQPYFKLSRNEYGKAWLFYKPITEEPGKFSCWMPIDDEFYKQFEKLTCLRAALDKAEKENVLFTKICERWKDDYTALKLENERLKKELERLKEEGNIF